MRTPPIIVAVGLALAACSSGPLLDHAELRCFRADQQFLDPSLAGWDEVDEAGAGTASVDGWQIGDRLLFGIELDAAGERTSWLVHVEVERLAPPKVDGQPWQRVFQAPFADDPEGEFGSNLMVVRVVAIDQEGETLSAGEALVPDAFMENGFYRACQAARSEPVEHDGLSGLSLAAQADIHRSFSALFALAEIVQESEPLSPILWEVVERPSLLTLLFSGVRLSVAPHFAETHEVNAPGLSPHAYCLPVTLLLNDAPALLCQLVVVPPTPPLQLAAGIVNVEGCHPYDPSRRFTARLLASRRCSPSLFSMSTGSRR